MGKLEIELIPSSSFYSNVRSEVSKNEWDKIRKKCYDEASDSCEICGDNGKNQNFNHNVECHEIWDFDIKERNQTLEGFIALCPMCHKSKHFGLSQIKGDEDIVRKHLKKVNGWNDEELSEHLNEKWNQWDVRSKIEWSLDIDYVDEYMNDIGVSKLDRMLGNLNKKK